MIAPVRQEVAHTFARARVSAPNICPAEYITPAAITRSMAETGIRFCKSQQSWFSAPSRYSVPVLAANRKESATFAHTSMKNVFCFKMLDSAMVATFCNECIEREVF